MKKIILLVTFPLLISIVLPDAVSAQPLVGGALYEPVRPEWMLPAPPVRQLASLDDQIDLSEHFPPIRSQFPFGSCVAWAWGYYYKTYQEWQEHGWDVNDSTHQFSPTFIYSQINGGVDMGSYASDAAKLLSDMGCATWADLPYDTTSYLTWPDEEDYLNAIPYRCGQEYYFYIFSTGLDPVKSHLLNGNAAVTYIWCYDNFQHINLYNNIYCLSELTGPLTWGHAVAICGFDDDLVTADGLGAFKIANSYGPDWGDNGYGWISYEAMMSSTICQGYVDYNDDLIDHTPSLITTFHVSHDDRYALRYRFSMGEDYSYPDWEKHFFDWYMSPSGYAAYPESNIVLDLSDGINFFNYGDQTVLYIRGQDIRTNNGYEGEITYFAGDELTLPQTAVSIFVPLPIPDNGAYAYTWLTFEPLSVNGQEIQSSPHDVQLFEPYPNPFNAVTVASFELRHASYVNLEVYDMGGRKVAELVDGWRKAGVHEVTFDAGDLPSGVYFARLIAGEFQQTQKVLLMR